MWKFLIRKLKIFKRKRKPFMPEKGKQTYRTEVK